MSDVTTRLPYAISKKMASTIDEVLARNGREIHYTIGGIPFRLRISQDTPFSIETAQQQKNQQDTEPEAGEQTLSGWWLRSQASFHEGAGTVYPENGLGQNLRVTPTFNFLDSLNIDPWTKGEVKLLRRAVEQGSSANRSVAVIPSDPSTAVVVGQAGAVRKYSSLGGGVADLFVGGGISFNSVLATDTQWFAAGDDGRVYTGPVGSSTAAPGVWSLTGSDTAKPTRIMWAKHHLFAVNGNKIYDVNYTTPGIIATPTATAAVYSHPSTSWSYTDIADAVGGVLFSGYGDGASHLQRITLDTDGSVPTLSGAETTAILPSDERALRICSLTGSLVCILTSRGVRIASADSSGALTYGPLMLERDTDLPISAKPALAASGRFWWVVFGDAPMVYRIDSSLEVDQGVFAYATDMNLPTATAFVALAAAGDRPIAVTSSGSLVYRHATQLEAEGWMQSGRIRYRTEEPKIFQFVDVSAAPLAGQLTLEGLNEADTPFSLLRWSKPGLGVLPTAQIPSEIGRMRFMSLKLTFTRASNSIDGPVVHGWQVKAQPASKPQRVFTLPLWCYDREKWSTGAEDPYGYEGWARDRYQALCAAEDAGGVVMLRDYRYPSPVGALCKIDEMKYVQVAPGNPDTEVGGMGGILVVTLRTLQ